ncbi:MAG TPA: TetR family transcriptional regulator [Solirubrobacterales bacterium]|nr:TetR family transcriptional regulator [Solirubrobacterales bacterium]
MSPRTPKTKTPRTGRRPGNSSTREDILEAAGELFAQRGYQGATMRAIGAKAGVDASLVVHFFGNKVNLLTEAIDWPFDPEVEMPKLLADGKRNVGRRLAELAIRTWDEEGTRHPVFTLLRAGMTEPEAAEMLRNFMIQRLYAPLMERLGTDQPELRAGLAVSQIIGVGMGRYVLKFEGLATATSSEVIDWLAPVLQRYLTGKL